MKRQSEKFKNYPVNKIIFSVKNYNLEREREKTEQELINKVENQ